MPFPLLQDDLLKAAQQRESEVAAIFSGRTAPAVVGQCYAFSYEELYDAAIRHGLSWHQDLLQCIIRCLWKQHNGSSIYIGYEVLSSITRVIVSSKGQRPLSKLGDVIAAHSGYMEQGQAALKLSTLRPLAYWEPPCTAMALWPTGLDGETDGPRVVDTANMAAYFSYPESDHDQGVPVDKAGPDYTRVPLLEESIFKYAGKTYRYYNRWVPVAHKFSEKDYLF